MKTEVLAVMFTDIVGFTQKTSRQTHAENAELLRLHARVVHPLIRAFCGRVVKEIGDAVLATFSSPTGAAQAAMAIQDRLVSLNRKRASSEQLHLRIAINVGEVRLDGGDVFGDAVNAAARLEAETPMDEIYVSGATYLTMNRSRIPMIFREQKQLKGLDEPVAIFSLPRFMVPSGATAMETQHDQDLPFGGHQLRLLARQRKRKGIAWGAVAIALLTALIAGGYWGKQRLELYSYRQHITQAIANGSWQRVVQGIEELQQRSVSTETETHAALEALASAPHPGRACRALDDLAPLFDTGDDAHAVSVQLRLQHAFGLIELGELAQAETCLSDVVLTPGTPEGRLLELNRIHLDAFEGGRSRSAQLVRHALERYEDFLRAGSAPAEHIEVIANVAASSYLYSVARPVADSLVVEFLKRVAVQPLASEIVASSTPSTARAWMVARLETIAHDTPVDWMAIYAAQLEDSSCTVRRIAIERLRTLGQLSSVGLLLREVEKGDGCTRATARAAALDLVVNGGAHLGPQRAPGSLVIASR